MPPKTSVVVLYMFSAFAAFLLAGCGGGSQVPAAGIGVNTGGPRSLGTLSFTLSTTKSGFAIGEPVPLTFTVKNTGAKTVDLRLGPCDWFDTKVTNGNQVLWQKSIGSGCNATVQFLSIAPGETKMFNYSWTQMDEQGNSVPAGHYTIKSWFVAIDSTGLDPNLSIGNQEANEYANPIQITLQ